MGSLNAFYCPVCMCVHIFHSEKLYIFSLFWKLNSAFACNCRSRLSGRASEERRGEEEGLSPDNAVRLAETPEAGGKPAGHRFWCLYGWESCQRRLLPGVSSGLAPQGLPTLSCRHVGNLVFHEELPLRLAGFASCPPASCWCEPPA